VQAAEGYLGFTEVSGLYDLADDIGLVAKIKYNAFPAKVINSPADGPLEKEIRGITPAGYHADVGLECFNALLMAGGFNFESDTR